MISFSTLNKNMPPGYKRPNSMQKKSNRWLEACSNIDIIVEYICYQKEPLSEQSKCAPQFGHTK